MRASIFVSVIALTASTLAVPAPEFVTLSRREVVMQCSSHNYQIMCNTTHKCQGNVVVHNGVNQMSNAFCTEVCQCVTVRRPLEEIDPNPRNKRPSSSRTTGGTTRGGTTRKAAVTKGKKRELIDEEARELFEGEDLE